MIATQSKQVWNIYDAVPEIASRLDAPLNVDQLPRFLARSPDVGRPIARVAGGRAFTAADISRVAEAIRAERANRPGRRPVAG